MEAVSLEEFQKTLRSLKSNDKYAINRLSMMARNAKEDSRLAREISKAALRAISEATLQMKLNFFYVVDSILKNVGSPYKEVFAEKLIDAFIDTFQSNKEHKIRIKLYNLRLTWKEHFAINLMNELDEQVRKCDPAWPLVTKFDPKSKSTDSKKVDLTDNVNDKLTPDSTTPAVSRDPRIQKAILPDLKKDRKRKVDSDDEEANDLFTIDRRGDNHIKKVVNKKGRLEETTVIKESVLEGLFGSKDVDLRVNMDEHSKDKQWTSESVCEILKRKMDISGNNRAVAKVEPRLAVSNTLHGGTINTTLPPPQPRSITERIPIPAPREPTWKVIVDGFPQLPHIGTDPRLLASCPYPDPMRTITIDGRKYILYLDRIQPCIFVNNELHAVRFYCPNIILKIDNTPFTLCLNGFTRIKINLRFYIACLGGPGHELIINGWPYNVSIDGNVHQILVGGFTVNVQFIVNRQVQVNVQNTIPPYVCEWAVKNLFGSPQYLNIPPLNPLRNSKFHDPQVNVFRSELNLPRPYQESQAPPIVAPTVSIDVHDLFQKLVSTGIIQPKKAVDLKLDITKYSWDLFKLRNEREISELYNGHQCDLCGTRFKNKDSKEFELHLDYHFYKNTTSLTSTRKSRDYVGGSRQWILGGSMRSNGPDFNFEETNCEQKFRCPKFDDDKLNKCAVCMEGFKIDWDDEEDSYMLLDGQLHNGKVYHPICLEDADKQLENSEALVKGDNEVKVELTDRPLEALEMVLQCKSDSVMLPDQTLPEISTTEEGEEKKEEKGQEDTPSTAVLTCQNFQYESVHDTV